MMYCSLLMAANFFQPIGRIIWRMHSQAYVTYLCVDTGLVNLHLLLIIHKFEEILQVLCLKPVLLEMYVYSVHAYSDIIKICGK